jgi:branched-chain amino acid aminotransferase
VPDYNNPESLPFGKYNTDHMVHVNWSAKTGWQNPRLEPFRDLLLSPFISGFHYGIQCYEGTKAYKNDKG